MRRRGGVPLGAGLEATLDLTCADVRRPSMAPDALWRHSRNSIRIARLLVHDGGSPQLVETACELAMECACRALCTARGALYDGELPANLNRLAAPREIMERVSTTCGSSERLDLTERVAAWAAACLRECRPMGNWSF